MGDNDSDRYIEIGRIGKARGLNGVVRFLPDSTKCIDLLENNALFYIKEGHFGYTPLRVEEILKEVKRNQTSFFVKFDRITNRRDAEKAAEKTLWADSQLAQLLNREDLEEKRDLTGYTVLFDGSYFGDVSDLIDNPAHPILVVRTESGQLLIPMVDHYISETDHSSKTITGKHLDLLRDL